LKKSHLQLGYQIARYSMALNSIFKCSESNEHPKVDQHSLFTSIQVSRPVLEGDFQINESWAASRFKMKKCHVKFYVNETSPFLVWYKRQRWPSCLAKTLSIVPEGIISARFPGKARCVLPINRVKIYRKTDSLFEINDSSSAHTYLFTTNSPKEADAWVEKIEYESNRVASLDLGWSSPSAGGNAFGSARTSPNGNMDSSFKRISKRRFTSALPLKPNSNHRKSASFSDISNALDYLIPADDSSSTDSTDDYREHETSTADTTVVKSTKDHIAASRKGHKRSACQPVRFTNNRLTANRRDADRLAIPEDEVVDKFNTLPESKLSRSYTDNISAIMMLRRTSQMQYESLVADRFFNDHIDHFAAGSPYNTRRYNEYKLRVK